MYVDLIAEWIGLILTPIAIVGVIVLLGTSRPMPNALAFAGGFAMTYSLMSLIVLAIGQAAPSGTVQSNAKFVVSIVIGLLFLAIGIAEFIHHPAHDDGRPKWATVLQTATPLRAFVGGTGLSLINPNVAILLSGLTIVISAEVSDGNRLLGALTLVLASLLPFFIPIGIFLIMGERARTPLKKAFTWMMDHDRVITGGTLLFFGAIFFGRGVGGLL